MPVPPSGLFRRIRRSFTPHACSPVIRILTARCTTQDRARCFFKFGSSGFLKKSPETPLATRESRRVRREGSARSC